MRINRIIRFKESFFFTETYWPNDDKWAAHYNRGRPHMSLGPGLPDPPVGLPVALREPRHALPLPMELIAMMHFPSSRSAGLALLLLALLGLAIGIVCSLAFTAGAGRSHFDHRLAVVAGSASEAVNVMFKMSPIRAGSLSARMKVMTGAHAIPLVVT